MTPLKSGQVYDSKEVIMTDPQFVGSHVDMSQ